MKPYYHTFEFKNRTITLCAAWFKNNLYIGYSVRMPEDEMNQELAKKIALGRVNKEKTRLQTPIFEKYENEQKKSGGGYSTWLNLSYNIDHSINLPVSNNTGVIKAIVRTCQRHIENGDIIIKGIR